LRQILTDFQNSFTAGKAVKFATKQYRIAYICDIHFCSFLAATYLGEFAKKHIWSLQ